MMMVLCPMAGSLAFTSPGDELCEVVSRCLPHRQLWVSNLSKVASSLKWVLTCDLPVARQLGTEHTPTPVAYLGVDMERCPPPSGQRLIFYRVIIYIAKIMGLLHAIRVQRKVRYFIHHSQRDIELN